MKLLEEMRRSGRNSQGYTLVEMMVVLVIAGILVTGIVFSFANPSAKVKGAAFNTLGDLNMARSEAVNRNEDVRVTFLFDQVVDGETVDGYRIWIDEDGVTPIAYLAGTDTLLRETYFPEQVQYYDNNATDGPNVKPEGGGLSMQDGGTDDDGVEFDGADEFLFTSRGTAEDSSSGSLDNTGYIYIFYPRNAAHTTMRAAPYAVVVSPNVGSVRISRWYDGAWSTK